MLSYYSSMLIYVMVCCIENLYSLYHRVAFLLFYYRWQKNNIVRYFFCYKSFANTLKRVILISHNILLDWYAYSGYTYSNFRIIYLVWKFSALLARIMFKSKLLKWIIFCGPQNLWENYFFMEFKMNIQYALMALTD